MRKLNRSRINNINTIRLWFTVRLFFFKNHDNILCINRKKGVLLQLGFNTCYLFLKKTRIKSFSLLGMIINNESFLSTLHIRWQPKYSWYRTLSQTLADLKSPAILLHPPNIFLTSRSVSWIYFSFGIVKNVFAFFFYRYKTAVLVNSLFFFCLAYGK